METFAESIQSNAIGNIIKLSLYKPPRPPSLVHVAANVHIIIMYVTPETATAISVPFGIAFCASFKSPLIFAPAMIPVLAGKKTLKSDTQLSVPEYCGFTFAAKLVSEYPVYAYCSRGTCVNVPMK